MRERERERERRQIETKGLFRLCDSTMPCQTHDKSKKGYKHPGDRISTFFLGVSNLIFELSIVPTVIVTWYKRALMVGNQKEQ